MEDLQLRKQNFEKAKSVLIEFAEEIPKNITFEEFEKKTFFGMMSKNVTGEEINELVKKIETTFIKSNQSFINIFKMFKEINNLIDVLDRQYIIYFESAIENIIKVSEKAQQAGDDALNAQKDISRTIEALKLTIEKLKKHEAESDEKINILTDKVNAIENNISLKLPQFDCTSQIKESIESNQEYNEVSDIHNKKEIKNSDSDSDILLRKHNEHNHQFLDDIKLLKLEFNGYKEKIDKRLLLSNIIAIVLFLLVIVQYFFSN